MKLETVAVRVSRDLKHAVFVGAFAVACHIGPYRQTRDLDLALATPVNDEQFQRLGYHVATESGKKVIRTPKGVKLDIFTRDVSRIPRFQSVRDSNGETSRTRQGESDGPGGPDGCEDARLPSTGH